MVLSPERYRSLVKLVVCIKNTLTLGRRARFRAEGLRAVDTVRPGRGPTITASQGRASVQATLHETPPGATQWRCRTRAKAAGVSHTTVRRIWNAHGLQPHRVATFKLSSDPAFVE